MPENKIKNTKNVEEREGDFGQTIQDGWAHCWAPETGDVRQETGYVRQEM